jgi:allantoicase
MKVVFWINPLGNALSRMKPDFTTLINLASERLGAEVLSATDDFFAEKENLIKDEEAVFKEGLYTDHGKWMDGWESRRKRDAGYDRAVVRLGLRGVLHGLDVDTSHFVGNHPPEVSVDGLDLGHEAEGRLPLDAAWAEVLPRTAIQENHHNLLPIDDARAWTHLRLNIYPDGGVARLRAFGEVVPVWDDSDDEIELSAIRHGGLVVGCSDQHFCQMGNLNLPDAPRHMGDGWETRRRRGPGHDWVIVTLGAPGHINRIELNTGFYKGNYPDRCSIDASPDADPASANWVRILDEVKMRPDHVHQFGDFAERGPFRHIRLNIYPDGGVARMRVWGVRQGGPTG